MDAFIGEIQIFGFNFSPRNWAACNGAILPIQQNTALFSLLGITYGGNGLSTFGLPDLRERAVCSAGTGPGLTTRTAGEPFGSASVTLTSQQMPAHTHTLRVFAQNDTSKRVTQPMPGSGMLMPSDTNIRPYTNSAVDTAMSTGMLGSTGGGMPHDNRQPYLALNFCIALAGTYPSRP